MIKMYHVQVYSDGVLLESYYFKKRDTAEFFMAVLVAQFHATYTVAYLVSFDDHEYEILHAYKYKGDMITIVD